MADNAKTILANAITEWTKFTAEREKMKVISGEVSMITRNIIKGLLEFLKTQKVDVVNDNPAEMKILGTVINVDPVVEESFPTVKASVALKCGGASRSIIINPNTTISAGGPPFMFTDFKKGIPETFANNAAEFVRDAFLNVARTGSAPK